MPNDIEYAKKIKGAGNQDTLPVQGFELDFEDVYGSGSVVQFAPGR